MIIEYRGVYINPKNIYKVFYNYCYVRNQHQLVVISCNAPNEIRWDTESTHILRFSFSSEIEVMECINEIFVPAMGNTNSYYEKKIRKLEKRQDELEAALKYITGNTEYRKAYQEFKELQFNDA